MPRQTRRGFLHSAALGGAGRVFYCSLGVQRAPYSNPLFLRYLLGGIQFAAGDLPADTTPSEN